MPFLSFGRRVGVGWGGDGHDCCDTMMVVIALRCCCRYSSFLFCLFLARSLDRLFLCFHLCLSALLFLFVFPLFLRNGCVRCLSTD